MQKFFFIDLPTLFFLDRYRKQTIFFSWPEWESSEIFFKCTYFQNFFGNGLMIICSIFFPDNSVLVSTGEMVSPSASKAAAFIASSKTLWYREETLLM